MGWTGQGSAIFIKDLKAASHADDDMITADHDGRIGRGALLGLGVINGFEALEQVEVAPGVVGNGRTHPLPQSNEN
jgi:hypothetical protein